MNLALKRSARMAWTAVMRFGCCLCICGILLGIVAVPKSKAVGAEVIGTAALATSSLAAYMTATGVPLTVVSGGAAAASAGTASLVSGYAAATGATYEVVTTAIAAGTTISGGSIILGAAAVAVLAGIVAWAVSEYGVKAGETPVSFYDSGESFELADGTLIKIVPLDYEGTISEMGSGYLTYGDYEMPSGWRIRYNSGGFYWCYSDGSTKEGTTFSSSSRMPYIALARHSNGQAGYIWFNKDGIRDGASLLSALTVEKAFGTTSVESAAIGAVDNYEPLPEMSEDYQLRIETGVSPELAPEAVPDAIFESIAGNEFAPTYVEEPVVNPDPEPNPNPEPDPGSDPDDFPDPESLGLEDLGEALTTRFPFSIPWDLYRAVKLLVAPAEAPYFEIDFLEPIAYRLPAGWQGSTTIVFDMAEYELIGQVSRWTSTVGFCLALIAGSKRFIWMS